MTHFINDTDGSETSSQCARIRLMKLNDQRWDRYQSAETVKNKGTAELKQEEVDRLAIERGEDDGMIVYQNMTSNA